MDCQKCGKEMSKAIGSQSVYQCSECDKYYDEFLNELAKCPDCKKFYNFSIENWDVAIGSIMPVKAMRWRCSDLKCRLFGSLIKFEPLINNSEKKNVS